MRGSLIIGTDVNVYGEECAVGSTIKARNSILNVKFYGYKSGDYAEIICESGDICDVQCGAIGRAAGCTSNTEFKCHNGATCTYDCSTYPTCGDCLTFTNVPWYKK